MIYLRVSQASISLSFFLLEEIGQKGDPIKEARETSCRQINANDSGSRYRCNHVEGRDNGVSITGRSPVPPANRPIDDRRLKADPAGTRLIMIIAGGRQLLADTLQLCLLPFFSPPPPSFLLTRASCLDCGKKKKETEERERERKERIGNRWRESLVRSIAYRAITQSTGQIHGCNR